MATPAEPDAAPVAKRKYPGYHRNDYIRLADYHKRPMRGGPTAGFELVIRKADSCLLEIHNHGHLGRHYKRITERKAGERFPMPSVDEVRQKLKQRGIPKARIEAIVRDMHKCKLGLRVLVNTTGDEDDEE